MARESFEGGSNTPSLTQYINISDFMYYGQNPQITYASTGLQSDIDLKPLMVNGKPLEVVNDGKGLYAEAFITTSGPRQIVIGYEGTNLYTYSNSFTGGQIQDDAAILAGTNALSYNASAAFAKKLVNVAANLNKPIQANNVFVTGHSLGAAEAEYAAEKVGLNGTTFGTPGIPSATSESGHSAKTSQTNVTDYVDYGDPVGNYAADGPNVYGNLLLSPNIRHFNNLQLIGSSSNVDDLNDAIEDYNDGDYDLSAYRFSEALDYHKLSNYASDLNTTLYPVGTSGDASAGADSAFFGPLLIGKISTSAALCFVTGTRIGVEGGRRLVERLKVSDRVATVSGDLGSIRWIGHRTIDCRRHPRPHDVHPIRIAAHAFGESRPDRDVYISPGHPVLVGANADGEGGHLVPIMCLINGTTAKRVAVDSVTYWHVELDRHDILLADNLPAESYLDWGDRGFFTEGADHELASPDFVVPGLAARCREVATDGPVVEAERLRLDQVFATRLSSACEWPTREDTFLR